MQTLEAQIGTLLQIQQRKLALAESCTGGLVGSRVTDVPGSSAYFLGGVIAYSYPAKAALLNVSWETLNTQGAVSEQTVREMARGVLQLLQADVAVSISGIAGPDGGTVEKPVGTTWIGLAAADIEMAQILHFSGDREQNKAAAAEAALKLLLNYLESRSAK